MNNGEIIASVLCDNAATVFGLSRCCARASEKWVETRNHGELLRSLGVPEVELMLRRRMMSFLNSTTGSVMKLKTDRYPVG